MERHTPDELKEVEADSAEDVTGWVTASREQDDRAAVPIGNMTLSLGSTWRHTETERPIDELLRRPWSAETQTLLIIFRDTGVVNHEAAKLNSLSHAYGSLLDVLRKIRRPFDIYETSPSPCRP